MKITYFATLVLSVILVLASISMATFFVSYSWPWIAIASALIAAFAVACVRATR